MGTDPQMLYQLQVKKLLGVGVGRIPEIHKKNNFYWYNFWGQAPKMLKVMDFFTRIDVFLWYQSWGCNINDIFRQKKLVCYFSLLEVNNNSFS